MPRARRLRASSAIVKIVRRSCSRGVSFMDGPSSWTVHPQRCAGQATAAPVRLRQQQAGINGERLAGDRVVLDQLKRGGSDLLRLDGALELGAGSHLLPL